VRTLYILEMAERGERGETIDMSHEREDMLHSAGLYANAGALPNGTPIVRSKQIGRSTWSLHRDGGHPVYLRIREVED
jgi:hypothetical protein